MEPQRKLPNPRPKWYTFLTQNRQPFCKRPLPPFLAQGGKSVTMWDKYPPLTFLYTFPTYMCTCCTSPTCPLLPVLLVAGNLHNIVVFPYFGFSTLISCIPVLHPWSVIVFLSVDIYVDLCTCIHPPCKERMLPLQDQAHTKEKSLDPREGRR